MNFCDIKEGVHVVGIHGAPVTQKIETYLEGLGQQVALYTIAEAIIAMPLLVVRNKYLPIALDEGYPEEDLRDLFRVVIRYGVHLVPVGRSGVWEKMVPLELPEFADYPVTPADSDWYINVSDALKEVSEPLSNQDTTCINGTKVCTRTPQLDFVLADVNSTSPSEQIELLPETVKIEQSCVKKAYHSYLFTVISVGTLIGFVILGAFLLLYSSLFVEQQDNGESLPPTHQATVEPKREIRFVLNNCEHCRERVAVVMNELIPTIKNIGKLLTYEGAQMAFDELMVKVAISADEGEHECKKCAFLKKSIKETHSVWHRQPWFQSESARYENSMYHKLKVGSAVDCYNCSISLEQPLANHKCPGNDALVVAFKQGADIGCLHCAAKMKEKLLQQHVCPNTNNRYSLAEGAKLGCVTCKKRMNHSCPVPKNREMLQAGADIKCPDCMIALETLKQHVCPENNQETALINGKNIGCEKCASRLESMRDASSPTNPVILNNPNMTSDSASIKQGETHKSNQVPLPQYFQESGDIKDSIMKKDKECEIEPQGDAFIVKDFY